MNRRTICVLRTWLAAAYLLLCANQLQSQTFPAGFQAIRLAQHLNPTDMKFSPDGQYLFIADKSGKIFMSKNDEWREEPVLDIHAQVDPFNERGFNHIAVDPEFNYNGYIYAYYTSTVNGKNKIARFSFNFSAENFEPSTQQILLTLDPMTATIHTGGAMNFGADGKLYVTTGESSNPLFSQSTTSMLGKVLRMNKDGSLPPDNPFINAFSGNNRYVYALGFRNPFTADIQPGTGRYFVCDVGQNSFEEINEVVAGKNYGWALIEGPLPPGVTPPADYQEPYYYYPHSEGCAIIGGVFYNPEINGFPEEYQGKFFIGDYCNQSIKVLDVDTKQIQCVFASGIGRPVAFAVHPNGSFYYLDRGGIPHDGSAEDNTSTNKGVLWKVVYTGSLAPTIAVQPEPVTASVGTNAVFGVIANGLGLNYQWLVNGEEIPGATGQSYTVTDVQPEDNGALFSCHISNPHGEITSDAAMLTVTNRDAPVPVIELPLEEQTYIAGTTIQYSGSATDAVDGTLPPEKLTWKIDFHHNTHSHPVLPSTSGISGGSLHISTNNEVSDNVWYRIYLTAENNLGIKTTIFRDIYPQKVTLNIQAPPGIALSVDGSSTPTPANVLSVKGVVRSLTAPLTYMLADTLFKFERWGNGSTSTDLVFSTPMNDTTITAVYSKKAVWNGTGLTGKYYNLRGTSNFNGTPILERIDPVINFNWGTGSPAASIREDEFSVRWTGFIQPRTAGMYTFYVTSNDGARLYVNGQLIINRWVNQSTTELSANILLEAGVRYSLQLDYFDSFAEAVCQLRWSGPGVLKQIIPQNASFTELTAPLPVNFVRFDIKPQSDGLLLNWTVEDLGNVKEYTVERSNGGAFEKIATIAANASSTYSYKDRSASTNMLYQYRIRETDFDGQVKLSAIKTGYLSGKNEFDFIIAPNPVSDNRLSQLVFTQSPGAVALQITTVSGSIIINKQSQIVSGQTLLLPIEGLSKGTYFVRILYQDKILTKRLVVL